MMTKAQMVRARSRSDSLVNEEISVNDTNGLTLEMIKIVNWLPPPTAHDTNNRRHTQKIK